MGWFKKNPVEMAAEISRFDRCAKRFDEEMEAGVRLYGILYRLYKMRKFERRILTGLRPGNRSKLYLLMRRSGVKIEYEDLCRRWIKCGDLIIDIHPEARGF